MGGEIGWVVRKDVRLIRIPSIIRAWLVSSQPCLRHFGTRGAIIPSIEMLGYFHFVPYGTEVVIRE